MAINVMSWAWRESRADGADLLVLLAIADQAHDDGDGAWPSIPTLAGKARVSDRTVQRCVRSLVALGELEVRSGAGRNGVNVYRVIMTRQDVTTDTMSPRQSDGVTSGPKVVTPVSRSGDKRVTRTVLNHPDPSGGTPPSEFCRKHPTGTEDNCGPCGTAKRRYHRAQQAALEAEAADRARLAALLKGCPDCDDSGFVLNEYKRPIMRCDHRKAAS